MPSRRVGGVTYSPGIQHGVALSSDTSAKLNTPRLSLYRRLAAAQKDLTTSRLYTDHVPPLGPPVNVGDSASDLGRDRTKSECMIGRSGEQQNMFVVPVNENIPGYPSKPIPPVYLPTAVPGMEEVYQYQGFRPVLARHVRQSTWTSLGYQVMSLPRVKSSYANSEITNTKSMELHVILPTFLFLKDKNCETKPSFGLIKA